MQLCRDPAQMEICNRGEECLMKQSILKFLSAPPEIRSELRQDAFLKNRRSLFLICIMIFFMELFNIARVLVPIWSGFGQQPDLFRAVLRAAAFRSPLPVAGPPSSAAFCTAAAGRTVWFRILLFSVACTAQFL